MGSNEVFVLTFLDRKQFQVFSSLRAAYYGIKDEYNIISRDETKYFGEDVVFTFGVGDIGNFEVKGYIAKCIVQDEELV